MAETVALVRDDCGVSNPLAIISTDAHGRRTIHQWSSYAELAAAYWSEQKAWRELGGGLGPELTAAIDFVSDVTMGHGVDGLEVVRALVEAAPNDMAIEFVGAGPLEDLIVDERSAPQLLDAVAELAAGSARWRQALAHVWVGASPGLDQTQRDRLVALGARDLSIDPSEHSEHRDDWLPENDSPF